MKGISVKEKEKLFCSYCLQGYAPSDAAHKAGYTSERAERTAATLLSRDDVAAELQRQWKRQPRQAAKMKYFAGLSRLALSSANDAVKLALYFDRLTEEEIDRLNLFAVAEFKKQKDGGFEVKLVDRVKALEALMELSEEEGLAGNVDAFYRVLQQNAGAIEQEIQMGEEDTVGGI